ncbi:hypothetical protein GGG16DRAFT_106483 [Schizophyllum commune]
MLSQRSHKRKTEDTDADLTLVEGAAAEEKTKLTFTKYERFWLLDGNIMLETGDIRGLKYCSRSARAVIQMWKRASLTVGPAQFYGAGASKEEMFAILTRAADFGAKLLTIGKWFTKTGRREEISLTTKFGGCDFSLNATEFYMANNKPDFIRERVETASKRLPTALNNLFCQHRRPGWEENAMAAHIQLTAEDVATLTDLVKKAEVQDGRYPAACAATISADCITLAEWEARK